MEISTRVEGNKAIDSIANTGPVIPPEQVHRLFDPFQRLDRTRVDDCHCPGPSTDRASAVGIPGRQIVLALAGGTGPTCVERLEECLKGTPWLTPVA